MLHSLTLSCLTTSLFTISVLFALTASAYTDVEKRANGVSDVITWDNYTLTLHNRRMFLHAGEFHPFRLPVPDLWLDIFQKMVAGGLNAVSVYIHMGLSNPSPGVLDFDDWRSLRAMYEAAKLAGIFVILRPGPYINGEATSGGISHWITSQISGTVRTNDSDWTAAYEPYIAGIINETIGYQVTEGGPVIVVQIDNENRFWTEAPTQQYFANLERQYRNGDIVLPLTYNDPGMHAGFINGTGAVDIYGLDAYPQGFDCSNPTHRNRVTTNYHQWHEDVNPSEPWYMPEFQGGSFDPWGGPGYDACEVLTGPDFEDVFYKNNWAANIKMQSYYMFYGGTSWGGIPFPGVYTSYDYGSAIRENRALTDKFDEVKRQAMFIRSSSQFLKTDWMGNSTIGIPGVTLSGTGAFLTSLRNPDSGTWFHVARQDDSTSTANISFTLTVPTSNGTLTIPQITSSVALDGRQSKVVITDYAFGAHGSVLYTTASVFFAATIGSRDVLFLYGAFDQSHEIALTLTGPGTALDSPRVQFSNTSAAGTIVSIDSGEPGILTLWDSDTQLVLFADPVTAATFWAPPVPSNSPATIPGFEHFFQFGTNTTVLVGGPYLVRNASIEAGGHTLRLHGDLNASVPLIVYAPESVGAVTWNGAPVSVRHEGRGKLVGRLRMKESVEQVSVPALTGWKYADSLPEVQGTFDDSDWIVANHTMTNIFLKPEFGDGRVLYGCDYGFCENAVLWRGHFNGTGSETSINMTIYGGTAFASSVWINDKFISTVFNASSDHVNALFTFPEGSVIQGQDNVITVLQDHMGNDEWGNIKPARGISGFQLNTGNISTWKVQGKVGGYTEYPDKVRGVLNEGGLYAERRGWHLPGFDTSSWPVRELSEGLPEDAAGVGFFVTTLDLAFPEGTDVLTSFQFEEELGQPYRALLFVNGWMFGKRVANLGPQSKFPVPPGVLNRHGKNTVAVALWAMEAISVAPNLQFVIDESLEGGVGRVTINNPAWTAR